MRLERVVQPARRCMTVFLAVVAILAIAAGSASAAHRKVPFGFFGVVVDPQVPRYLSPSGLDSQMALMARSGVESVRTNFYWSAAARGIRPVPIVAWQIWNEPEGYWDWLSTPWDKTYMGLLAAAYKAIHRADRHAKVISASLVGALHETPWSEARALYKLG